MDVKSFMQQAHQNKEPNTPPQPLISPQPPVQSQEKVTVTAQPTAPEQKIQTQPTEQVQEVQPQIPVEQVVEQQPVTTSVQLPVQKSVKSPEPRIQAGLPTGVVQIARDDVPVTSYGVKPVATNFNCYNKELFKWLKDFSSDNQFNGGVAITKSQIIEIMLDVMYYDLGINPIGYESQQALREDIQNKIKGLQDGEI